jgi:AcrR family transcriptional regulator
VAEAKRKPRAGVLGREDWIRAAIDVIVRGGADALRIDRLCDELEVTKGSFYHHFANRDDLVEAIAEYWARTQPEQVVALLGNLADAPLSKLKLLIKLFTDLDIGTRDHAMRAFGASESRIAAAVDEADKLVLTTLIEILRSLGFGAEDARTFAKIMMFSAIGFYTAPNLAGKNGPREIGRRILDLMMEHAHVR